MIFSPVIKQDELKISFLEVGQGDSIVLEWINNLGTHSFGIIDCKKHNSHNPTVQYLRNFNIENISFIVLTHPHSDHYDGFPELLSYLEDNNISVDCFYLTTIQKEFLVGASKRNINRTNLAKLVKQIYDLCKSGLIKKRYFVQGNNIEVLNNFYTLNFISPCSEEYDYFLGSSFKPESDCQSNNQQANSISAVTLINSKESSSLLTADTTIQALVRIKKENLITHRNNFLLGQVPHHGSINNHFNEFWDPLHNKDEIPVVISCGNSDKHPNQSVLRYFNNNGKRTYLTRKNSVKVKPHGVIRVVAKKKRIKPSTLVSSENRVFSLIKNKVTILK